jgi:hypothetical protein
MIGRWKHVLTKDEALIVTQLYRPLRVAEKRALGDAVQRYGAFF